MLQRHHAVPPLRRARAQAQRGAARRAKAAGSARRCTQQGAAGSNTATRQRHSDTSAALPRWGRQLPTRAHMQHAAGALIVPHTHTRSAAAPSTEAHGASTQCGRGVLRLRCTQPGGRSQPRPRNPGGGCEQRPSIRGLHPCARQAWRGCGAAAGSWLPNPTCPSNPGSKPSRPTCNRSGSYMCSAWLSAVSFITT